MLGCEVVDLRSHEDHPHYVHEENSRVVQNAHQERSRQVHVKQFEEFQNEQQQGHDHPDRHEEKGRENLDQILLSDRNADLTHLVPTVDALGVVDVDGRDELVQLVVVDGFRVDHAAESAHEEATTFEVN